MTMKISFFGKQSDLADHDSKKNHHKHMQNSNVSLQPKWQINYSPQVKSHSLCLSNKPRFKLSVSIFFQCIFSLILTNINCLTCFYCMVYVKTIFIDWHADNKPRAWFIELFHCQGEINIFFPANNYH